MIGQQRICIHVHRQVSFELLKRSDVAIEGKNCVIVGRSNIVGKPMAMLMLRENATVTVTHSIQRI